MSKLTRLLQDYREKISRRSVPEVLKLAVKKAGGLVYGNRMSVIFERDLQLDDEAYSQRFNGEILLLRKDNADVTRFERYFAEDMDFIKHLFSDGMYCVAMTHEGDVVGQVWFADRDFYAREADFHFKVKPNELYQFYGVIHPRFRGTSISHDTLKFAWNYFRARGYEKVTCYVECWNWKSMKLHKHMKFKDTGLRLRRRNILWMKRTFLEGSQGELIS